MHINRSHFAIFIMSLLVLAAPRLLAEEANFKLTDLEGKTHQLSDYRGKWVVVNYWATWCPPCLDEIPELVEFHEKSKDAVVLGIDFEDISEERLRAFVENNFISYPIFKVEGEEGILGPIAGMPTTYIISPAGQIAARHTGPLTGKMIRDFISSKTDK
jgi:thiol-disulfide isomerase/thioredoxin